MIDLKKQILQHKSEDEELQIIMNDIYHAQTGNPTFESVVIAEKKSLNKDSRNELLKLVFSKHYKVAPTLSALVAKSINDPKLIKKILKEIVKKSIITKSIITKKTLMQYQDAMSEFFYGNQNEFPLNEMSEIYKNSDENIKDFLIASGRPFTDEVMIEIYEKTDNERFLPQSAQDIFIF